MLPFAPQQHLTGQPIHTRVQTNHDAIADYNWIVEVRYTVVLEREPDNGYVAAVPILPGCVSQGDTREEALRNIREAIELYVEDCLVAGDPVPQEDSVEYVELVSPSR